MQIKFILLVLASALFVSFFAHSQAGAALGPSGINEVRKHIASEIEVAEDFRRIMREAKFSEDLITVEWIDQAQMSLGAVATLPSTVHVKSKTVNGNKHYVLEVRSPKYEWAATAYYGLQKIGFLFPHPRIQVSPTEKQIQAAVGKKYTWHPRFLFRGFHFHTMHPSEWLQGFLMGKKEIGRESIRWLARNGQNVGQVVLLEQDMKSLSANLGELIK